MSTHYHQLLDAAIRHLERLKAEGVRFIEVSPAALSALAGSPPIQRPPANLARGSAPAQVAYPPNGAAASVSPANSALAGRPVSAATNGSHEAKVQAMADLRERALICTKCPHLASSRKKVAFGVGDINASLMFIGEAPGADEDEEGEPFVGRAGQLLNNMIKAMGLQRRDIYIANIIKCRPPGNRTPERDECETCSPFLMRQIAVIQPKVIVALGRSE